LSPDYAPKGIGRLIDEAIAVYRAEFRTLALPAAYLLLPVSLVAGLAQGWYGQVLMRQSAAVTSATDPLPFFVGLAGPYALLGVVVSLQGLVALYYFACVLAAAPALLDRRRVSPGEFLKGGASRVLPMFVISLAVWSVGTIPITIGVLLLIIPGVIVAVALNSYVAVTQCALGVERAPLGSAFGRGIALMRGHFWRSIGFLLAIGIIVLSLESALTSITSVQLVIQQVTGATHGSPLPSFGWQFLSGLLQGVAQTLTLPLLYVGWLFYYLDLRARREGMDLLARANALNAA
jgi:hypothetical protein